MADDDVCTVCPKTRKEHEAPDVHHLFSEDGNLVRKAARPQKAGETPTEPLAARLVGLLLEKGVIDANDVVSMLERRANVPAPADSASAAGRGRRRDPSDRARSRSL